MNSLTAAKGEKSAMRPFAKLLWTHVNYFLFVIILSFICCWAC